MISMANLDDTGGGADLSTAGATVLDNPNLPALLKRPLGAGAPSISNGLSNGAAVTPNGVSALIAGIGNQLSCGDGSWAPDLLGAFLYRAPASFGPTRWLRDGAEIAGATEKTYSPDENGSYTCRVTASNRAGSSSQTSAPTQVTSNKFSFGKVKLNKKKGTAKLTVKVPGAGKLKLKKSKTVKGAKKSPSKAGKTKLNVKPKGKAKKQLNKKGKAKVKAKVSYKPTGGSSRTKTKKLKLKKRN